MATVIAGQRGIEFLGGLSLPSCRCCIDSMQSKLLSVHKSMLPTCEPGMAVAAIFSYTVNKSR